MGYAHIQKFFSSFSLPPLPDPFLSLTFFILHSCTPFHYSLQLNFLWVFFVIVSFSCSAPLYTSPSLICLCAYVCGCFISVCLSHFHAHTLSVISPCVFMSFVHVFFCPCLSHNHSVFSTYILSSLCLFVGCMCVFSSLSLVFFSFFSGSLLSFYLFSVLTLCFSCPLQSFTLPFSRSFFLFLVSPSPPLSLSLSLSLSPPLSLSLSLSLPPSLYLPLKHYLKSLGMARTAQVKCEARKGEAEALKDSGIKVVSTLACLETDDRFQFAFFFG